jgi:hypothetical protein
MWVLVILMLANPHDVSSKAILKSHSMPKERCLEILADARSSYNEEGYISAFCAPEAYAASLP